MWLAGASAGGGLALDAALIAPRRVAGLVVMGTAVSGAPEPELDADTKRFDSLLEQAYAARDAQEINRLETWLWLDGPGQPEGRVGGPARKLALDMNAAIIGNGVPETEGAAGVDAWHRLAENPCHQAIFMNHAPCAVTPLNPELIQVGNAIG